MIENAVDIKFNQELSLFINGDWHQATGREVIEVFNPANNKLLAKVSSASVADVNQAVNSAQRAFASWKNTTNLERANWLEAIATELGLRRESLAKLSTLNNGKPLSEAYIDVDDAIACYRYYAELIKDNVPDGKISLADKDFQAKLRLEPIGVVGLIVPWNFPLVSASWKIAPALAAGCTLVFKPSEITPLPEFALGDIVKTIGLPAGVINIVVGGAEVGQALVEHPQVSKISFTGSNPVGEKVMCSAAPAIKNISLELGGKSPIIVSDDVDVDLAVEWIIGGIYYNAGQMCSATSRLLVHEKIADVLLSALVKATEKIIVGDGLAQETQMGAITHKKQYERILEYFALAKEENLTLLTGGYALDNPTSGYFIAPTIYADVPRNSQLWQEEIFGPVLCVQTFASEEEAIALANDCAYGLAASVVSRNEQQAQSIANALEAGHIWINTLQVVFPETSWGGFKRSGIGRELGPWGLAAYQEVKHIIRRL